MIKRSKRYLSVMLTGAMLLSNMLGTITVSAETTNNEASTAEVTTNNSNEYEIYPAPQSIEYQDGITNLNSGVNIVYESGIDEYTKARLEDEILKAHNINYEVSTTNEIVENKTNILVGIEGSGQSVDTYADEYSIATESLFSKTEAYFLAVDNNTITVLGKDTDSAFYGLTTLYHVVNQIENNEIRNFKIEDYANVVTRGFIEGYYGNPWSVQDRVDLMTYGGYYKLNAYFYAPKDDPKHRTQWRTLYTEDELTWIKQLADAGNASKTRFVYGIHPFPGNDAFGIGKDEAGYQKDLSDLKAKLKQVIDQGVRQVAILADDFANPGGELGLRLVNDITNWLENEVKLQYPDMKTTLPYIPFDYMGNGSSTEFSYLKQSPENVQLVMTGGKVWGEVTQSFSQTVKNNIGRAPYYWINWPCSDNSKKHLIMGGNDTFLHPGVDPTLIEGIMLNPMQQSEANKSALFAVADYSWNIWETKDQANQNWNDSFKYMDHNSAIETESSSALREISKHMINQNMDNRVTTLQESVELAPKLTAFKEKYTSGASVKEDALELIEEFTKLKDAADYYKNNPGNEKTRDQIIYWLNCWEDTTTAVIGYLNAIIANEEGNNSEVWTNYSNAQSAFEKSKTYGFNYVDHLEYAEVGVQHIVPFIESLEGYLEPIVLGIVDPSTIDPNKALATVITNRTDVPTGNLNNVLDDKESTEIVYKNPNSIEVGTYIGIKYNKVIKIKNIEFLLGAIANSNDTMQEAKVQYTVDGENWIDLESGKTYSMPNEISIQGLDIEAIGVRVIATKARSNTWFGVKDINVNKSDSSEVEPEGFTYTVIKSNTWGIYQGTEANLYDGDDNSFIWYDPDKAYGTGGNRPTNPDSALVNDYLGYDLGRVLNLESTHIVVGNSGGDKFVKYAIETSINGTDWTPVEGYSSYSGNSSGKDTLDIDLNNIEARYIRIRNLQLQNSWVKFSEFTVKESPKFDNKYVYTNTDLELGSLLVNEGLTKLVPQENITLNSNEYVGVKLDRIKDLSEIALEVSNMDGLTLQTSMNENEWFDVNLEDASSLENARYIRLIASKDVTFNLNKFEVKSNEIYPISLESSFVNINGNVTSIFDKNFNTSASFDSYPRTDKSIVFDLGQTIDISNITYAVLDTEINYLRDAKFQISSDGQEWTDVITIGDGVENDSSDMNSKPVDAGYEHGDSTTIVPISHAFMNGELDTAKEARYLRILFTADYDYRWVRISEILINDGEYVPSVNNPTYVSNPIELEGFGPKNINDGNLTTAYKPNTNNGQIKSGSLTYRLSENTDVKKINIIQSGNDISNAKVMVRTGYTESGEEVWNQIGTLDKSLNEIVNYKYDNIYEIRIDWEETAPTIYELVTITDYNVPNISDLESLVESSNDYVEENYTVRSFVKFREALENAKVILNDLGNANQEKINNAKDNLSNAINELVSIEELSSIINEANDIKNNGEKYTEVSLNILNTALENAVEVLRNEEATKEMVSSAVSSLRVAIESLVKEEIVTPEADKTLLTIVVDYAEDVKAKGALEDVVPAVVEEFEEALKEAKVIIADENATQEQVDIASDRLINVIHMLEFKKGDKTELKKLVEVINALDESKYTTSTWAVLQAEIENANKVIADENAMEEEVTNTYESLNEAFASLELAADKSKLEKLVSELEAKDLSKYTTASANKFNAELNNAKAVLIDNEVTQEQVDEAYNKLIRAYLELRLIPDKSKLEELIKKAEEIDVAKYTEESVSALNIKLKEVKDVLDNEEASQDEVNKASEELEIALSGLEEKKDNNNNTDNNVNNDDNSGNNSESNNSNNLSGSGDNENNNSGNDNSSNLPLTGGTSSFALAGIAALLVGYGAILRRRK
jgi:hyaluronoglucosaminidase